MKFDWGIGTTKANTYQGVISGSLIGGMTIGAVSGGKLMSIGRRKAQYVNMTVGILGICITQYWSFPTIIIGRFLFGLCTGSFSSTVSRYIEETIPTHLFENLQPIFCFSQTFGGLCGYLLGEFLPDPNHH